MIHFIFNFLQIWSLVFRFRHYLVTRLVTFRQQYLIDGKFIYMTEIGYKAFQQQQTENLRMFKQTLADRFESA